MNRAIYQTLLLAIISMFLFPQLGLSNESFSCAVCGMEIKPTVKTSFESQRDGKAIHFCSFSCASAFRNKYPETTLYAYDFDTHGIVDVSMAYFLIKSKNLLKEIEFGMEPTVVAFANIDSANKTQARLKDGEVIKGYDALKKIYR